MKMRIIISSLLILLFQIGIKPQQTIWFSPYEIIPVAGNVNLNIQPYGGAVIVTSNTSGDLQWIIRGLNLPSNQTIDSVIINYQLTNAASYISQVRIAYSQLIQQYVMIDDGTDLLSTTPDRYALFVGQPVNGLITLAFRLNFASTADQIYIGAIGVVLSQPNTSMNEKFQSGLSEKFKLEQNYPNPFNPETKIDYYLKSNDKVTINIYDVNGHLVKTLLNEDQAEGHKSVIWNGKDNNGKIVSSGVYFYQVQVGNHSEAKKMIMLK